MFLLSWHELYIIFFFSELGPRGLIVRELHRPFDPRPSVVSMDPRGVADGAEHLVALPPVQRRPRIDDNHPDTTRPDIPTRRPRATSVGSMRCHRAGAVPFHSRLGGPRCLTSGRRPSVSRPSREVPPSPTGTLNTSGGTLSTGTYATQQRRRLVWMVSWMALIYEVKCIKLIVPSHECLARSSSQMFH